MPTVQEILKQTGFTDEQISALEPKAITAFSGVLSAAEQARQQAAADAARAEVERRSNAVFYENEIVPALNGWAGEKAAYDGEIAFYKSQLASARASGVELAEAPGQARDAGGRYAANVPGATPGSPVFQGVEQLRRDVGTALGTLTDIQWKYQSLYGKPMPISPTELVRQAESQRLDPAAYAAREFRFAEREREQQEQAQRQREEAIRAEERTAADRRWAEKIGSNPDVRIGMSSRFADVARAQKAGERPDPLQLNEQQRRQATSAAIRKDIAEQGEAA